MIVTGSAVLSGEATVTAQVVSELTVAGIIGFPSKAYLRVHGVVTAPAARATLPVIGRIASRTVINRLAVHGRIIS